jgi:hypothetical protein
MDSTSVTLRRLTLGIQLASPSPELVWVFSRIASWNDDSFLSAYLRIYVSNL